MVQVNWTIRSIAKFWAFDIDDRITLMQQLQHLAKSLRKKASVSPADRINGLIESAELAEEHIRLLRHG